MTIRLCATAGAMAVLLAAQKPFADQAPSSIRLTGEKDGERTISIRNVTYQYTQDRVPGRPVEERLTLRTITDASDIIGDIPQPGRITMEAWPLGAPLTRKPIYAIKMEGNGAHTVDNCFWVVDRGYEDLRAWSVYKLGSGQHMFDTYVDFLQFSITKGVETPRYVGLEVPPDDAGDARLKDPHVVAVVSYASADKVIREVLLTHTNPARARDLRAYEDTTRTVTFVETPSRRLKITFIPNGAGAGAKTEIVLPLKGDDLDTAAAQLPAGMQAAAWKR